MGASTSPCSDTFGNLLKIYKKMFEISLFSYLAGPSAFSEPETQALDAIFAQYASRTDIFLSVSFINKIFWTKILNFL